MFILCLVVFVILFSWTMQSGLILYQMIYEKKKKEEDNEDEDEDKKKKFVVPFEEKYLYQYDEKKRELKRANANAVEKKEELKLLKNNYIIEHTPLGNVAMFYDCDRESFCYYSDNVIPYKYLETVARKYILVFNCLDVYVDMKEELEKVRNQILLEKEKAKEEERKKMEKKANIENGSVNGSGGGGDGVGKKSVFTKFKSYNTGSMGTGTDMSKMTSVSSSIKGKSAGAGTSTGTGTGTKELLKENANRYTCEGRFSIFFLLKKIDKALVDKRLKVSFAEFKNMNMNMNMNKNKNLV